MAQDASPTTVMGCWKQMLVTFLEELQAQLPEDSQVARALERANTEPGEQLMQEFSESLAPKRAIIMASDPALFQGLTLLGIDFQAVWEKDLAPESREACYQYFGILYMLASTISSIPPQLLSTIESVAQGLASSISDADGGQGSLPDMASLFGALAGGGGPNQLSGLLNSSMAAMLSNALATPRQEAGPPANREHAPRATGRQQPRRVAGSRRAVVRRRPQAPPAGSHKESS